MENEGNAFYIIIIGVSISEFEKHLAHIYEMETCFSIDYVFK